MVSRKKGAINPERVAQDRIAQAIFAATESVGISDRELVEQITSEVIHRLERGRLGEKLPLPGMESLIPGIKQKAKLATKPTEINETIKTTLIEMGHPEIAKAYLSHQKQSATSPSVIEPRKAEPVQHGTLKLQANALRVLEKRYLRKSEDGEVIETAEEMFRRVAHSIASAEMAFNPDADVKDWEERFYNLMVNLEFLPNSPTLMNAGRELGQLSACFVLPVEDSMDSIFEAVKHTAMIHKSGGGTGFSFSKLRPENDRVGSTGGVASGPVSFIRAFDTATDVIKQGGTRRGANMAVLSVDHPDILKFITAKENNDTFSNFNFSVATTEKFVEAVESSSEYELINPHTKKAVGRLNAREVFDTIIEMAWKTGDPGIVFIDRINRDNPTPHLGEIESTNPCGEQPLLPYESCNLGSINLNKFLRCQNEKTEIDYPKLSRIIGETIRFLDNVIEVNKFPLPQISQMSRKTRKVGLGVMGFADMLIQLGIPYDSEEAPGIADELMRFISQEALVASVELGNERGVFPAFEGSIYDVPGDSQVRNAARTTIAPTGTLSIIAGCSSGIEPLFALSYTRTILEGEQLLEVNPLFEEMARKKGFYSEDLMRRIAESGTVRGLQDVPEEIQKVFVTAHDISPEWHVRMQAAFQKYTDNAVSKTVNLPHHATKEEVADVFFLAYKEGCKGITIYRDGSKDSQVLSVTPRKGAPQAVTPAPRKRPGITRGFTKRVSTGCGHIYITVNSDERGPCEVFSSLGKSGGCASAQLEAISRLISLALRSGIEPSSISKYLRGIRCPSIVWEDGHAVLSCPDAIGSVLEGCTQIGKGDAGNSNTHSEAVTVTESYGGQCPDCGNILVYQEGCHICHNCGYTKCG